MVFVGALALAGVLFWWIPGSFVPPEDQGYLIGNVQLPDGATLERTGRVVAEYRQQFSGLPQLDAVNTIVGNDFIGGGSKSSAASLFIILKPWDERDTVAADVARTINRQAQSIRGGTLWPSIRRHTRPRYGRWLRDVPADRAVAPILRV